MNRRHADSPGRSKGFTLIEVMIALLITGIALPALMFQLGSRVDSAALINDRTFAGWVAQDQLALLRLRLASGDTLNTGEWQGEAELADRRWYWLHRAEASPAPGLLRHTIRVATDQRSLLSSGSAVFSLDAYLMVADSVAAVDGVSL